MQFEDCFEIGYILKPHGLDGALSIRLDVDDLMKYKGMESVIVNIGGNLVPFFISSLQFNGEKGILRLKDVATIDEAGELKSCTLLLPLEQLPKLDKDQFYFHEVIGYKIVDRALGELGIIENIFSGGNQDLISMKYKEKEILIPINDALVGQADHSKKEIQVSLPEGLLEIYL